MEELRVIVQRMIDNGEPDDKIKEVFGIFKAYTTRVGSGPFPTELFDETGKQVRKHLVINDRDDYVWTKIRERHLNADVELLKKFIKEYK